MTEKKIIRPANGQIFLGKQGENAVREVRFDLPSNLMDCECVLNHRRTTDAAAYPVALRRSGNDFVWDIFSGDVAIAGRGEAELTYCGSDGEILKSETYATITMKSVETGGEAPDPVVPYLARIAQAADKAEQQADAAEKSAASAAKSAQDTKSVEVDWNALEGQPGHIKNRTHWAETVFDVVAGTAHEISAGSGGMLGGARQTDLSLALHAFTIAKEYRVSVNGVEHLLRFEAGEQDPRAETGWCYFGFNIDPFNAALKDSSVGAALYFVVGEDEADITPGATAEGELICAVPAGVEAPITIQIYDPQEVIHPLEAKYIPDSIPRQSDIPAGVFLADCELHWDEEDEADEAETCLFSTTFAEINAAIQRGEFVVARLKDGDETRYLPLAYSCVDFALFSQASGETIFEIFIDADGFSEIYDTAFLPEEDFCDFLDFGHLYLQSPNGTRFKITVDDSGTLSATEADQ